VTFIFSLFSTLIFGFFLAFLDGGSGSVGISYDAFANLSLTELQTKENETATTHATFRKTNLLIFSSKNFSKKNSPTGYLFFFNYSYVIISKYLSFPLLSPLTHCQMDHWKVRLLHDH